MLTGSKLMYLRIMHGKSQQDIAKQVGCTREYISQVEHSKKPMTEEMYQKIISAIHSKNKPISKGEENINKPVEKSATVEPEKPTTAKKSTKKTSKAKG